MEPYKIQNTKYGIQSSKGIAALITIVTITLFLIMVGFLVVGRSGSSLFSGQYASQGIETQFLADAGVQDALIKLARDNEYRGSYSISDTGWTTDISVISSTPLVVIATSTITRGGVNIQRTVRAQVTLDVDGAVTSVTKENL